MHETLNRQLIGFGDTLAVTVVLIAYLVLCALPPFLWSRSDNYHPVWRGIEFFVCYAAVAIIMGAIFSAAEEGDWSTWSGMMAGGEVWIRVGSLAIFVLVFIVASWLGGKRAAKNRRHRKGRDRGNKKTATS